MRYLGFLCLILVVAGGVGWLSSRGHGDGPGAADSERSPPGDPWFREVAAASGVDYTHDSGLLRFWLPEIM